MTLKKPPPIYPLTVNRSGDHTRLARELLENGAGWLQIRDKSLLSDRELLRQIDCIQTWARSRGALILVNDRVDLAMAAGVAGVHLGQDDLPPSAARRLMGRDCIVGLSTHNLEQFEAACDEPVDYLAVGPIFPTSSKFSAGPPLGLPFLARIRPLTDRPLIAIGGITLERARQVWDLGIDSVAVVGDIVQHESPGQRLRQYLELAKETI